MDLEQFHRDEARKVLERHKPSETIKFRGVPLDKFSKYDLICIVHLLMSRQKKIENRNLLQRELGTVPGSVPSHPAPPPPPNEFLREGSSKRTLVKS